MSIISEIEAKLSDIETQIKTHSGYVTDIATAIEKLASDKITSIANVNILNGAKQAYTDTLNSLKAAESGNIAGAISSAANVVSDVAPIVSAAEAISQAV